MDAYGLKIWAPAERNKQVILEELLKVIPPEGGLLLEIASATGQHAEHFARALPQYTYQPSDYADEHLQTLRQRAIACELSNLRPPLLLDVLDEQWPLQEASVIYNANMIHIAPWSVSEGLFAGAARLLSSGGLLITYGPYVVDGKQTSESNERFDASLRERNSAWGIRDLRDLRGLAQTAGLVARAPVKMPANNFLVVWDKI